MDIHAILEEYGELVKTGQHLMVRKNQDYGNSWEEMRSSSITDQILVKVRRIKQLEDLEAKGESPQVSEGIESEIIDIMNYCVLLSIRRGQEGKR